MLVDATWQNHTMYLKGKTFRKLSKCSFTLYILILNKNTPGVKKGEAKLEPPEVTLFIYSTKKIDIMQVEAKACITDRIV